jgi:hypothetical protein
MNPFIAAIELQIDETLALLNAAEARAYAGSDETDKLNEDLDKLTDKLEYWLALAAGVGE